MRLVRLLAPACVIVLAVTATAQQPAATPAAPAAVNQTAPPVHPATEDQIREYMALSGISKTVHDLFDSSVAAMQATSAPWYPASFWDDMRSEFMKIDIVTLYVPYYQRYISQSDMQTIIDFYRSPAGKNLLAASPLIVRDAKIVMKQKGEDIGIEVYNRHKDEIEAAKKQYDAQHPAAGTN